MAKLTGISHATQTPSYADVRPRDESDAPVFRDLYEVLKKHGAVGRFGICLLHDHFEIAPDELLMESVDEANRTLTLRPVKVDAEEPMEGFALETAWRFEDHPPGAQGFVGDIVTQRCVRGCRRIDGPDGSKHYETHKWGG